MSRRMRSVPMTGRTKTNYAGKRDDSLATQCQRVAGEPLLYTHVDEGTHQRIPERVPDARGFFCPVSCVIR